MRYLFAMSLSTYKHPESTDYCSVQFLFSLFNTTAESSSNQTIMTEPIPGPKSKPFVGNMLDLIDDEAPLRALEHLAEIYGPIYKLTRQGNRVIIVSSVEIMEEICDETRFIKAPPGALSGKSAKPSGLFTAQNDDPDWGQAHRILMPAFGPLAIEGQFERAFSIIGAETESC